MDTCFGDSPRECPLCGKGVADDQLARPKMSTHPDRGPSGRQNALHTPSGNIGDVKPSSPEQFEISPFNRKQQAHGSPEQDTASGAGVTSTGEGRRVTFPSLSIARISTSHRSNWGRLSTGACVSPIVQSWNNPEEGTPNRAWFDEYTPSPESKSPEVTSYLLTKQLHTCRTGSSKQSSPPAAYRCSS